MYRKVVAALHAVVTSLRIFYAFFLPTCRFSLLPSPPPPPCQRAVLFLGRWARVVVVVLVWFARGAFRSYGSELRAISPCVYYEPKEYSAPVEDVRDGVRNTRDARSQFRAERQLERHRCCQDGVQGEASDRGQYFLRCFFLSLSLSLSPPLSHSMNARDITVDRCESAWKIMHYGISRYHEFVPPPPLLPSIFSTIFWYSSNYCVRLRNWRWSAFNIQLYAFYAAPCVASTQEHHAVQQKTTPYLHNKSIRFNTIIYLYELTQFLNFIN